MNILATLCNPSELNIPHVPTGRGILEERGWWGKAFFFVYHYITNDGFLEKQGYLNSGPLLLFSSFTLAAK